MLIIGGMTSLTGAVRRDARHLHRLGDSCAGSRAGSISASCRFSAQPGLREVGLALVMLAVLILRPSGLTGGRELGWPFRATICRGWRSAMRRSRTVLACLPAVRRDSRRSVRCGGGTRPRAEGPDRDRHRQQPHRAHSRRSSWRSTTAWTSPRREINAAGGVDGRKIEIVHVDAKSDLNLSATAALEVIEKGADVVVPMCDADLGAPGARAANDKGILAITCAGAPGIGRQMIGPLTFNTYTGSPTESAIDAEYAYRTRAGAARTSSAIARSNTRRSSASRSRRAGRSLGGKVVGEDTFLQSDVSIALAGHAARQRLRSRISCCSGPTRVARRRSRRSAPPTTAPSCSRAAYSGTFWLKATPHLSNAGSLQSAPATATTRAPR